MTGTSSGPTDVTPTKIAHYELADRVGHGGMGSVYRARDDRSGATVALKVIHPHLEVDPDYVARFEREAHIASLMRSPQVVHVLDAGTADGRHYMATEFIEGYALSALIKEGPIDGEEALALAMQVARALDEAHQHDVVHRDIKPDNVMLTESREVKVTDFGIARQRGVPAITIAGGFVGTFAYSAPERFLGEGDIRSDIYSLGVMLFQMLTGQQPYRSDTPAGVMRLHETQPPPLEMLAETPGGVTQVVRVSLEKDIERRYATPAAMIAAIEEARRSLSPTVPPNWVEQALSRLFDRRVAAVIAAGGVLSVALGGSFGGGVSLGSEVAGIAVAGVAASASGVGAGISAVGANVGRSGLQSVLSASGAKVVAAAVLMAVCVGGAIIVVPRAGAIGSAVKSAVTGGGDDGRSPAAVTPGSEKTCEPVKVPVLGPATSDPIYAGEIFALRNTYRVGRGLRPLPRNTVLETTAAKYARFFVETRFWVSAPGRATSPGIHFDADCHDQTDRALALGYGGALIEETVMYADLGVTPGQLWARALAGAFDGPEQRDRTDQAGSAFDETGVACFVRRTPAPSQITCVQLVAQAPKTASPTATSTPTQTNTPRPPVANTPLPIATNTPPPPDTPSPTATNTITPTRTPTRTPTPTPTPTPTETPTPTDTPEIIF